MDVAPRNPQLTSVRRTRTPQALCLLGPLLSVLFFAFATEGQTREGQPAVLILDQSEGLPAYAEIIASLRSTVLVQTNTPTTFYTETLDLSRFQGPAYQRTLDAYLEAKYRGVQIDAIVALGARALDYATALRAKTWTGLPVVFALVSDAVLKRPELPANVTGHTIHLSFANLIVAAKAVVPSLKRIALVGDPIEKQAFRFHFAKELPAVRSQVDILDLTGLPMRALKERVANLPGDTAIVYTTINVDGDGKVFTPGDALIEFAKTANRPIVTDIENHVRRGAVGGLVVVNSLVGHEAGKLTARVLGGEDPSAIPVSATDAIRPVFDWRQVRRWGVSENDLPPGSDVRFRELTMWEQHRWRVIVIAAVLLLQTALIFGLLYEDRRRRAAEASSQKLLGELSHLNRVATAGELTASIAHEVRQPLAAIVSSGAAGLNWLNAKVPDLEEVRTNLQTIVNAGHRADNVIKNIRAMFRNETPPHVLLEVNDLIRDVLTLTIRKIDAEHINLRTSLAGDFQPVVRGDPIQLQQVLLNLIVNAIDAMSADAVQENELLITSAVENNSVVVTVKDTGIGIAPDRLDRIFDAFVTTKPGGMGLGLSICKSIIESHRGTISAAPADGRGSVFRIVLPLAGSQ